jgi:hypothetical protein
MTTENQRSQRALQLAVERLQQAETALECHNLDKAKELVWRARLLILSQAVAQALNHE